MFQSQGRFFGGSNFARLLWQTGLPIKFQSQGRFFGGSNLDSPPATRRQSWRRFNRRGDSLGGATPCHRQAMWEPGIVVSIAGAILWGEQPDLLIYRDGPESFQSQGRFFGGATTNQPPRMAHSSFNRRGDSWGGATAVSRIKRSPTG